MNRLLLSFLLICFCLLPRFNFAQSFNLELLGHLSYAPVRLSGCWHHVDSSGGEYGLIGTSQGLSIVDLNNPSLPVERFQVPGRQSNWREVKTWGGFAYVGSEADSSGITIVDLRELPDTILWKVWYGDTLHEGLVKRSHTVQAEDGYLYIFGGSVSGAAICDLADPWNPVIRSIYSLHYVHDGFIRGDTLWTSEIYMGQFGVLDISDRSNPFLLASHPTPAAFNHNTGLSDDGRYLFTTDEKFNAPLGAFDVSDLDNITLLDTYKPSQFPSGEVHNVRVFGNFLINPSYQGQLTIVDATYPDNLIETGLALLGNDLVWDADPYLPSGIVFATEKSTGLFIYQPTYKQAAYLEGTVTDATTGQPLPGVTVALSANTDTTLTLGAGDYKTGSAQPGTYTAQFFLPGYYPYTADNVALQTGQITVLNVQLLDSNSVIAVHTIDATDIAVSPTLFSDQFRLTLTLTSPFAQPGVMLRLLDVQGRIVVETAVQGAETTVSGLDKLPAGPYWLQLQSGSIRSKPIPLSHTPAK